MKKLTVMTALLLFLPSGVQAQNNNTQGYVPPPLFGAPRPVPPKKATPDVPTMPKLSLPTSSEILEETSKQKTEPKKELAPVSAPKSKETKQPAIPLKKPEHPKDNFEGKPVELVPEEKNNVKSNPEPIDLMKQAPKPSSEGIVKGPKTMPSNKKESVETEVLFETNDQPNPDLMNRIKTEDESKKQPKNNVPPPKLRVDYVLPSFDTTDEGSRKLNLIFEETQSKLSPEQMNTLGQLVVPALKNNKNSRLLLEAFASPQDNSLGDRRLALTRAMAIRAYITEQGVSPNRLDVRSLGAQTDVQPMDRVKILVTQ